LPLDYGHDSPISDPGTDFLIKLHHVPLGQEVKDRRSDPLNDEKNMSQVIAGYLIPDVTVSCERCGQMMFHSL
jgi:hypothetical protein